MAGIPGTRIPGRMKTDMVICSDVIEHVQNPDESHGISWEK